MSEINSFKMLLTKYRERSGLTKTRLAEKLNPPVSPTYIMKLESGIRPPTPERCREISRILNLADPEEKIFIETAKMERAKEEFKELLDQRSELNHVPVISWVLANRFEQIEDPFPLGISDETIITTQKGGSRMFALKVKSDCMEPEFVDGDIIIVNPEAETSSGDFVIIKDLDSNEATFKQLKRRGGKLFLHPLNPKYQDIELDHKKNYKIVGKVVEKIKKY